MRIQNALLLLLAWVKQITDKLTELLTKFVARRKIQIPIPVGIVFYYMPFDATLVLHMNNVKGCLPRPHLQLPLAVFKRIQTVKILVGRP